MNVAGSRYDVGMIGTFEEAREAVRAEIAPLVEGLLHISPYGREDEHGYVVWWAVESIYGEKTSPLPGALTIVDKTTGFVSITARAAEADRLEAMTRIHV